MKESESVNAIAAFYASVSRYSDRPAIEVHGRKWSYLELNNISSSIANYVRSDDVSQRKIAVISDKSVESYAAMLAIMGSGDIYVPISPEYPASWNARQLKSIGASMLICSGKKADLAYEISVLYRLDVILIDGSSSSENCFPFENNKNGNILYMFFSSGSTGLPKAIPVSDTNMTGFIEAASKLFGFRSDDRFAQITTQTFDVSLAELFLCWHQGGTVVVPNRDDLSDLIGFMSRSNITVWSSTPTLGQLVADLDDGSCRVPSVRYCLFCGETLTRALASRWNILCPNAQIVNCYGPTEATIFVSCHFFSTERDGGDRVPIGRMLEGVEFRICRSDDSPGELLLAGPQVFDGYYLDGANTEAAFIGPGSASSETKRWYRTGDLVYETGPVGLHFVERIDRQVKVRGHRLSLLAVEESVAAATGVKVAVVPVYEAGLCTDIVAFCERPHYSPSLRKACRASMPEYMIPSMIAALEMLPLTASKKIDYGKLAAMGSKLRRGRA